MDRPGEGLRLAVNGDEGRSCSVKERSFFFLLLREELSERERVECSSRLSDFFSFVYIGYTGACPCDDYVVAIFLFTKK